MSSRRIPHEVREQVLVLYRGGEKSPKRISEQVGQPPGRVRRILVDEGVYVAIMPRHPKIPDFQPHFSMEISIPADVVRGLSRIASDTENTARGVAASIVTEAVRGSEDDES